MKGLGFGSSRAFDRELSASDSMEAAIDRIVQTRALAMNSSAAATESARIKVTDYVSMLSPAGEKNLHRQRKKPRAEAASMRAAGGQLGKP